MANSLIKAFIRTRFAFTSRAAATGQIRTSLARYLRDAARVDAESGARSVRVPAMPGIDPDMRRWSFFQTLEHNAIVNRRMAQVIQALVRDEEPAGFADFDPKRDVMPAAEAGPEQVENFQASVEEYLAVEPTLGRLRGTRTRPHPIFGPFDAHRWHCMLAFHLQLHQRQARHVVTQATEE